MFSLSNCKVGAAVAVSDMMRARGFYEGVLRLVVDTDSGDNVAYRCGDNSVIHVFSSPNAGTAQATVAGWSVDDIDAAVAELGRQGVEFERYATGPFITDDRGVAVRVERDPPDRLAAVAAAGGGAGAVREPVARVVGRLPDERVLLVAIVVKDVTVWIHPGDVQSRELPRQSRLQ